MSLSDRWHKLLERHAHASVSSLGRLWRTPFATMLTLLVIGVALALPACLYVLLGNVQSFGQGWDKGAQISLFLKVSVSQATAQDLASQLKQRDDVANVTYISPQDGLKKFQAQTGIGDIVEDLHSNPLPAVLEVQPTLSVQTPKSIEALLTDLKRLPQVDIAELDMQWLKRLYTIIEVIRRGVWALAALLGLAVLLVIGNTIRLSTQNRRQEIEIIKLIGATNSFIRRPFLYSGMYYGLFGAIIAWILVSITISWLNVPVVQLAKLYSSQFSLHGLGFLGGVKLACVGIVLGFFGSWFSVNRHLRANEL